MPTASPTEAPPPGRCFFSECGLPERTAVPRLPVKIGQRDTWALIDSGSHLTLVRPEFAEGDHGEAVEVTCIHGDVRKYPTQRLVVQTTLGTFTVWGGVVPELPVPLLLGRDCPILDRWYGGRQGRPRRTRRHHGSAPAVCAALTSPTQSSGEGPEGEATGHQPEPVIPGTPNTATASEGEPLGEDSDPAPGSAAPPPPGQVQAPDSSPLTTFSDFPLAGRGGRGLRRKASLHRLS